MQLDVSNTAKRLTGQPMFGVLSKVKQAEREGREIIHYEIGDQKNILFLDILDAMRESIEREEVYYTESQGFYGLREAICEYTYNKRGFRPSPDQVVIAPANALINYVIQCTADPGNNIIFPDPGFCTYLAATNYYDIEARHINFASETDFRPNFDNVHNIINKRSKTIIINSPCNPTGVVMTKDEIKQFYDISVQNNSYLLSDEVYSNIVYDGEFFSPTIYDGCTENTILLNSFSKSFCVSGCRIGYVIAPRNLAEKIALLVETTISCAPLFIQKGAITALGVSDDIVRKNTDTLKAKRDLLVDGLNTVNGIKCYKPHGAFYVFANISKTGMNGQEFADYILEKCGISALDGAFFGSNGQNHVRFSYGYVTEEQIKKSIELLKGVF